VLLNDASLAAAVVVVQGVAKNTTQHVKRDYAVAYYYLVSVDLVTR